MGPESSLRGFEGVLVPERTGRDPRGQGYFVKAPRSPGRRGRGGGPGSSLARG